MPIKVLQLVTQFAIGGRTAQILALSHALDNLNVHSQLLALSESDNLATRGRVTEPHTILNPAGKLSRLKLLRGLRRFVQQEHIQLIHTHCETSYEYGGLVGKLLNIPVIGTYHRSRLDCYQPSWRTRLRNLGLSHKVAVSHNRSQLLSEQLGLSDQELTVIHNGIDLSRYNPDDSKQRSALRETLNLSSDAALVLSIGHLGEIKGHDFTLQAFPTVLQQHPNARLAIAGTGTQSDEQRLRQLMRQLNLSKHVTLLGQVEHSEHWFQACDIFVQPSLEEAFGLVFAEAGAMAKPTIATRVGGIPEIIQDQTTGILVPPKDPQAIAEQLSRLISSPETARQLGLAARDYIVSRFDIKQTAAKYKALYQRFL